MAIAERLNGFIDWAKGLGLPWWAKASTPMQGYVLQRYSPLELEAMWRGDSMVARIIERPAEDMVREGWAIETGESHLDEEIRGEQEDLGVRTHFRRAVEYRRAYGGGAILIGADRARNLADPLVPGLAGDVAWLQTFEADRLTAVYWDTDIGSRTHGLPIVYRLQKYDGEVVDVHRSRLLIFNGKVTSLRHAREHSGWGDPVVMRVTEAVQSYKLAWSMASELVKGFSQPVYRLLDLYSLMETPTGQEVARKRIDAIKDAQSSINAIVLDKEDEFQRVAVNMTGLTDYLREHSSRVAADADIPATLLMGMSPAGMDATGESDIRGYYDRIHAAQEVDIRPQLERLTSLQIAARRLQPGNFKITFRPLWQPTDLEVAQIRKTVAETDQIYVESGVIDSDEIAESRFREGGWSMETHLDRELRGRLERVAAIPVVPKAGQPAAAPPVTPPPAATTPPPQRANGIAA